jgi:hypothetical protein
MSLASLEHEEVEQFTHEFEALFNSGGRRSAGPGRPTRCGRSGWRR